MQHAPAGQGSSRSPQQSVPWCKMDEHNPTSEIFQCTHQLNVPMRFPRLETWVACRIREKPTSAQTKVGHTYTAKGPRGTWLHCTRGRFCIAVHIRRLSGRLAPLLLKGGSTTGHRTRSPGPVFAEPPMGNAVCGLPAIFAVPSRESSTLPGLRSTCSTCRAAGAGCALAGSGRQGSGTCDAWRQANGATAPPYMVSMLSPTCCNTPRSRAALQGSPASPSAGEGT